MQMQCNGRIEFLVGPRKGRIGVVLRTNPDNESQWLVRVDGAEVKLIKRKVAEYGAPVEGKFAKMIDDHGKDGFQPMRKMSSRQVEEALALLKAGTQTKLNLYSTSIPGSARAVTLSPQAKISTMTARAPSPPRSPRTRSPKR